jgi:hypothetical protein
MKKGKLTTSDEDEVIIVLQDKEYEDYKESIDHVFFSGDKSEVKWNIVQFKDGMLTWWNSDELEIMGDK